MDRRVEGTYGTVREVIRAVERLRNEGYSEDEIVIVTDENQDHNEKLENVSLIDVEEVDPNGDKSMWDRMKETFSFGNYNSNTSGPLTDFGVNEDAAGRYNEALANGEIIILVNSGAPSRENQQLSAVNEEVIHSENDSEESLEKKNNETRDVPEPGTETSSGVEEYRDVPPEETMPTERYSTAPGEEEPFDPTKAQSTREDTPYEGTTESSPDKNSNKRPESGQEEDNSSSNTDEQKDESTNPSVPPVEGSYNSATDTGVTNNPETIDTAGGSMGTIDWLSSPTTENRDRTAGMTGEDPGEPAVDRGPLERQPAEPYDDSNSAAAKENNHADDNNQTQNEREETTNSLGYPAEKTGVIPESENRYSTTTDGSQSGEGDEKPRNSAGYVVTETDGNTSASGNEQEKSEKRSTLTGTDTSTNRPTDSIDEVSGGETHTADGSQQAENSQDAPSSVYERESGEADSSIVPGTFNEKTVEDSSSTTQNTSGESSNTENSGEDKSMMDKLGEALTGGSSNEEEKGGNHMSEEEKNVNQPEETKAPDNQTGTKDAGKGVEGSEKEGDSLEATPEITGDEETVNIDRGEHDHVYPDNVNTGVVNGEDSEKQDK